MFLSCLSWSVLISHILSLSISLFSFWVIFTEVSSGSLNLFWTMSKLLIKITHGIFHARIMELVAISSSRGSSWPRDQNRVSFISLVFMRVPPSTPGAFPDQGLNPRPLRFLSLLHWQAILYRVNQATQLLFSSEFSYWAILILLLFISLMNK